MNSTLDDWFSNDTEKTLIDSSTEHQNYNKIFENTNKDQKSSKINEQANIDFQNFQRLLNDFNELDLSDQQNGNLLKTNPRIQKYANSDFKYLIDPSIYFEVYEYKLTENSELFNSTNITKNNELPIHNWSEYIQGFSGIFVKNIIQYLNLDKNAVVYDPFLGSGTVCVEAKKLGIKSIGTELNPAMHFISKVKTDWNVDLKEFSIKFHKILSQIKHNIPNAVQLPEPSIFLKETKNHFNEEVRKLLWLILEGIRDDNSLSDLTRDLLVMSIITSLISLSNMVRNPSLGKSKKKNITGTDLLNHFEIKFERIFRELANQREEKYNSTETKILLDDAKKVKLPELDCIITSPPYANGMDYVINYKIELAWGNFALDYSDLRNLKEKLVVCDNSPKNQIRKFKNTASMSDYVDLILDDIIDRIGKSLKERKKKYRREDQPYIIKKYFHDIFDTFQNILTQVKENGYLVLVLGDSLVADVYVPTDLLVARMAENYFGFKLIELFHSRNRRSGQRVSFSLRETVAVLQRRETSKGIREI